MVGWGGVGERKDLEGREENRRTYAIASCLLKHLDENSERKIILHLFLFKDPKWRVNKNSELLFERHKPSSRYNTIKITEVMAVIRGKHTGKDTS